MIQVTLKRNRRTKRVVLNELSEDFNDRLERMTEKRIAVPVAGLITKTQLIS